MNKFLNRSVKYNTSRKKTSNYTHGENHDILEEFAACWTSLETAREKFRRSVMYAYEDQWGDYVKDPATDMVVTEAELIRRQGKVPLKNNMISPIIKNIDGQFRNNVTQTICTVRDSSEAKIGEMMSIALEYVHDINDIDELDSNSLRLLLCGGFIGQRIEYGYNSAKRMNDVWVYGVNPSRMFFNSNIEDVRGWDLNMIGEIFDMPIDRVIALFAKNKEDRKWIKDQYGRDEYGRMYSYYDGLTGNQTKYFDFYNPARPDMCRVILGWKLETREAYFCNDTLRGTWWYEPMKSIRNIEIENERRKQEGMAQGVEEEDILLIEYTYKHEQYWYYRYMTPTGMILQEGESPYWHESHNYVFHVYPMLQGKVFNFVEDFIDQQRVINRTMTLIDFIRGAGAKGAIVVDESAFDTMSREELIDEYVRYNGVIFAKPKNGQNINNVIAQLNGNGSVAGDYELLNLQLKLINDISGVNSAMQGKSAPSGTAASLYAQQVQNSSLNLKGLYDSFKTFRKRRDTKVMQTIQQYYTSARHIDLSGSTYSEESKYYNPEKVQGAEIDLKITDGSNSPSFQYIVNDFLMQLLQSNMINVKTMLENCTYPFATKILESIKRDEQQMQEQQQQQQQQMQDIDPAAMQQLAQQGGNQELISKMLNDRFMANQDGTVQKQ